MKEDSKGEIVREREDEHVQELRVEHIVVALERITEMVAQLQTLVARVPPDLVLAHVEKRAAHFDGQKQLAGRCDQHAPSKGLRLPLAELTGDIEES